MILDPKTPLNLIEIWAPRWRDRVVLVAPWKVGNHNKVVFTRAKSMPGEYYLSGKTIRDCKLDMSGNGKSSMYAVPIDKLEKLEKPIKHYDSGVEQTPEVQELLDWAHQDDI